MQPDNLSDNLPEPAPESSSGDFEVAEVAVPPVPAASLPDALPQTVSVTLKLPADVVTALSHRARHQGQLPSQVLVEALRMGLGLIQVEPSSTPADWQQLHDRLTALEQLLPRLVALETTVDRLLPAGSPVLAAPSLTDSLPGVPANPTSLHPGPAAGLSDRCPRCEHRLGPPLKTSGRQVCSKCGWSNKPRRPLQDEPAATLPADDLSQILSQAAQQSLNNMKPKAPEPRSPKLPFRPSEP